MMERERYTGTESQVKRMKMHTKHEKYKEMF